ncbi:Histidine kinase [Didymella heteroderae]|uniref:histidine kinase n=1 Tax=Didymella heteroderae TaxID=1769908 RepID=A0A9P4WKX1_9PLEO|nr:Histidine kinase [Didymella heteroderae]
MSYNAAGTFQVDIVINNAGVSSNQYLNDSEQGPIEKSEFDRVYTINVLAPLLLTQLVQPYLPKDRSGRIVNVSSVSSSIGYQGQSVYAGTKAAIEAMTRVWSRELAENAIVNCVNPGPAWGDMYERAGPAFWNINQPYVDVAPLAKYSSEQHCLGLGTDEKQRFDNVVSEVEQYWSDLSSGPLRSDTLMLTASLKSAQLSSNLLLMQILVKQATMRLSPQVALESYYRTGQSTHDQWEQTVEDYDAIFAGDENTHIAVQARIYHKEGSDRILFNRTASSVANVTLPYERPDRQPAVMGDYLYGYIPELYPRFSVRTIDRTSDQYDAEYQGKVIDRTNSLLSGPYRYETLEDQVHQRTAELERSKEAAEAANKSKTLFIANISHELKTPLNGILGMCAVCMSENDPLKLRQSVEIIHKSGELLLKLLTDLLMFSKNEMGQSLTLDEKVFSLRDIISQVLAIFGQQAKESELWLSFEFEVADTGPGISEHLHSKIFEPFVQGDLGLNKKYGGTGLGLSICSQLASLMRGTIGMKSEVSQGSVFALSIPLKHVGVRRVATQNAGVDSVAVTLPSRNRPFDEMWETQSCGGVHSMQPMQACSRATLRSEGPPSVVPATVASDTCSELRLVDLGQLHSASAPSPGQSNTQAAPLERSGAEVTKHGGMARVLVAEDNKTNQEVMVRILKLEDVHDVTIAEDGQEALDKVQESLQNHNPYDLVFMDVQMPNLDGLHATRLLRQSGFTAPIVALTAYTEVHFSTPSYFCQS